MMMFCSYPTLLIIFSFYIGEFPFSNSYLAIKNTWLQRFRCSHFVYMTNGVNAVKRACKVISIRYQDDISLIYVGRPSSLTGIGICLDPLHNVRSVSYLQLVGPFGRR